MSAYSAMSAMDNTVMLDVCGMVDPGDPRLRDGRCMIGLRPLTGMCTEDVRIAEKLRQDTLCRAGWELFVRYTALPAEETEEALRHFGVDSISALIRGFITEGYAYLLSLTRAEEVIETLMPAQEYAAWQRSRDKLLAKRTNPQ